MDAAISAPVQVTLQKLLDLATPDLSLVWDFKKDLRKLDGSLKMMDRVLQDAEKREVTEEAVKLWLKNLRDVTYDADHVLDEINYENMRHMITRPVNEVLSVLPIVGMGGLGKTTLARSVFNHQHTHSHFALRIWVCVSENFDVMTLFKRILESLGKSFQGASRQAVVDRLREKLEGKRYLLVLDDLWNENREAWEDFKNTMAGINPNSGNVIMVTTRQQSVASIVRSYRDPYSLKVLTNDECWSIIRARTFGDAEVPERFEKVGKEIARKCRGLPLAANMVGGTLQGKEVDEWDSVLEIGLSNLEANPNSIEQMPPKIGILSRLQTLPFFRVGDKEGCRIEELGFLKNLTGKLDIYDLELVNGIEEAKKADLFGKPKIYKLHLIWGTYTYENVSECNNNDESVLEGLQPHQHLKSLTIEGFRGVRGSNFASWTMRMEVFLDGSGWLKLDKLIEINFKNCKNCEEIPMFGHLPLLKYLTLHNLTSVRSIGPSFYGGQETRVMFPALERLILKNMPNLTEWAEAELKPLAETRTCREQVFPRLKVLEIEYCHKLNTSPSHFPCLKELKIVSMDSDFPLTKILSSSNLTSLEKLSIRNISTLTCLPHLKGCQKYLRELIIEGCDKLRELPDYLHSFWSLKSLRIIECLSLQSISYQSGQKGPPSLRRLEIRDCSELSCLPSEMIESIKCLEELYVTGCEKLISFPIDLGELPKGIGLLSNLTDLAIGGFSESIDFNSFQAALNGIQQSKSLRHLTLYGWEQWDSLPYQLQYLTSLSRLKLVGFGIEALPEWFGGLSSLKKLNLIFLKKLRHMPSKEAMQRLTNLEYLQVYDCPLLEERCREERRPDSEWSKISHIPFISSGLHV
ncbi:unnamed protein product [Fraxinus pennsylvanica]|uniref:Disease resistance protein RGA3 n=1 Tax=Fraxinus pennsylvanica TaxID=56036 RepID=A0AAD1Z471_9LAMI|nr:unnamed protein product [Fraxinus pennsylvanica]